MAADVRAATPSNAAQLLVPDRREIIVGVRERVRSMASTAERSIDALKSNTQMMLTSALDTALDSIARMHESTVQARSTLRAYDPQAVLRRGYALVRGDIAPGEVITIETEKKLIEAEVHHVTAK